MKAKMRNSLKKMFAGLLVSILLLQTMGGISFESKATTSTIPTGFTELNWADFSLGCKEYVAPNPDAGASGSCSSITTLHQTLLCGNVKFGAGTHIRYGGKGGWYGLVVGVDGDGQFWINSSTFASAYNKTYAPGDFGLTTFTDTEINLKISTEISDAGYTFGIWVNDVMVGDYFTLTAAGDEGVSLGLYDNGSGNKVTLYGDKLPTDYTTYTHENFGIAYGSYTAEVAGLVASGSVSGISNFDEAIIHFPKTTFSGDTAVNFAGDSGWSGFKLYHSEAGALMLTSGYGELIPGLIFDKTIAGVENISGSYDLKITIKYIDDTHIKLGVWFNDVLYNNQYVQVDLADATRDKLGTYMGVQVNAANGIITLEETIETLPTDYTIYTLEDFDVPYASYTPASGSAAVSGHICASDFVNFDKSIIHIPQITFNGSVDLNFAGTDGWTGFKLRSNSSAGTLELRSGYKTFIPTTISLTDDVAGVDLVGGTYDLKISIVYTDTATIKMGLLFNDVLYNNEYFTIDVTESEESNTDKLGSYMGITYVADDGTITFSEQLEKLPVGYTTYTITDFGLVYRSYTAESGLVASGAVSGIDNLDQSIIHIPQIQFEGDVDLNFLGSDGWTGLKLHHKTGGTMTVKSGYGDMLSTITLDESVAGVTSLSGPYDLKISTEYTENSMLKVGLWFNDVLYNDAYIEIDLNNLGRDTLGTYLGIMGHTSGGMLTLSEQQIPEVITYDDVTLTKLASASGVSGGTWGIYPVPENPAAIPGTPWSTVFKNVVYDVDGTEYTTDFTRANDSEGFYMTIPGTALSPAADGVKVTIKAGQYASNDGSDGINILEDFVFYVIKGSLTTEFDFDDPSFSSDIYWNLDDGAYIVTDAESVTIDGNPYNNGDSYTTIGVHELTYEMYERTYTRKLVIYRYGDLNDTDTVSLHDYMIMKKYMYSAQLRPLSDSAMKGADINCDESISVKDADLLAQILMTDAGIVALCPENESEVQLPSEAVESLVEGYQMGDSASLKNGEDLYARTAITIKWLSFENVDNYQVMLATKADFSDAVSYETQACTYNIYNLLVDTTYYWKVVAGDYETAVQTFHTADTIRTLYIEEVPNTRDIGGYVTGDGKSVKYGMIYRGGHMSDMTEEGLYQMLNVLGVKTDLDLRTPGEGGAGSTKPLGEDVNYYNYDAPYYWGGDTGLQYAINGGTYQEALRNEIRTFANADNYPIYVHCSLGRDRTGTIMFLINGLLGVEKEDLYLDYELSFLSAIGGTTSTNVPLMIGYVNDMYNAIQAYAPDGTFAEAVEAFMLTVGVTQEEIDSIRELMLETK